MVIINNIRFQLILTAFCKYLAAAGAGAAKEEALLEEEVFMWYEGGEWGLILRLIMRLMKF